MMSTIEFPAMAHSVANITTPESTGVSLFSVAWEASQRWWVELEGVSRR